MFNVKLMIMHLGGVVCMFVINIVGVCIDCNSTHCFVHMRVVFDCSCSDCYQVCLVVTFE